MFVRRNSTRIGGREYCNYLLVESYRTARGPRNRVILTLGSSFDLPKEKWKDLARAVENILYGTPSLFEEDAGVMRWAEWIVPRVQFRASLEEQTRRHVEVDLETLSVTRTRELGPEAVGHFFWKRLGFEEALRNAGLKGRYIDLAEVLVLNRLISPRSEHSVPDWVRRTALDDLLGVLFDGLSEDPLYRVSDALFRKRVSIERSLYEREKSLFGLDGTILLYDITSTYFEGIQGLNPGAAYGYSRDGRGDCKQVLVGLALDGEGFVLCHEVFTGNRNDSTTIGEMLDSLEARCGRDSVRTVVVDRGMSSEENPALIRGRGYHYIVASRGAEFRFYEELIESAGGVSADGWNEMGGDKGIRCRLMETKDELLLLCESKGRKHKERAIRDQAERRLLEALGRLASSVERGSVKERSAVERRIGRIMERFPRAAKYYNIEFITDDRGRRLLWRRNDERLKRDELLDGCYILRSSRKDLSGEEIWNTYTMLTRVERGFEYLKSDLGLRPVFHRLQHRVEGHIFITVLAYHLLHGIEYTLKNKDIRNRWSTVRDTLATHARMSVGQTGKERKYLVRINSNPEPQQKEIYNALDMTKSDFPSRMSIDTS